MEFGCKALENKANSISQMLYQRDQSERLLGAAVRDVGFETGDDDSWAL